ncbi:MAG TPA: hypothetical protein VK973_01560 [Arenicellales bacterium]|nr:hypothetical protein [Arenicellales bacterium]
MTSRPRESAALILCLGAALCFPPLALIFARPALLLGVPLPVFYIFGVWILLVAGAVVTTRLLPETESSD